MSDRDIRAPFPGEAPAALYSLRPGSPPWPVAASTGDALSDPDPVWLAEANAALLPLGAAWRTPDGAAFAWDGSSGRSLLGGFLKGLTWGFVTLYQRAFGISEESTPSTIVDSLDDWEAEFGLPSECFGPDHPEAFRRTILLIRFRSQATVTPQDFIDLAAFIGYEIEITEPAPFECGVSECGVDELAGSRDPGGAVEFYWSVKPNTPPPFYFECGLSECGVNYLTDFVTADKLECVFNKIAPAWTRPIFDYS